VSKCNLWTSNQPRSRAFPLKVGGALLPSREKAGKALGTRLDEQQLKWPPEGGGIPVQEIPLNFRVFSPCSLLQLFLVLKVFVKVKVVTNSRD